MVCFTDPTYTLPYLIAFDLFVYLLVCVQPCGRFHRFALGVNFSFAITLAIQYYKPDLIPDDRLSHVTTYLIFVVLFWIFLSLGTNLVFILAAMVVLGPFWNSARVHASHWLGLDDRSRAVITFTIITFALVAIVIVKLTRLKIVAAIFDSFICTLYGAIAVNVFWSEGLHLQHTTLCCQSSHDDVIDGDYTCPVSLHWHFLLIVGAMFALRLYIQQSPLNCTKKITRSHSGKMYGAL